MPDLALRLHHPVHGAASPRRLKRDLETILAGVLPKRQFTGNVVVVPEFTAGGHALMEVRMASQETGLPPSVLAARLRHVAGLVRSKCIRKGWGEVPPVTAAPVSQEESESADIQIDPGIFSEIYDRDAHIRIITEAIRLAMRTAFRKRCHVLLYGPPACAKTEILKTFSRVLAPHGVLSLDATATTKAGVERLLLDAATPPNFILAEEMEKKEEEAHRWLLSVMDQRGEISKINFTVGSVSKAVPALVIATVNDIGLFERMLSGALASRFQHKLYCGRPDRALLERILAREVENIEGDRSWIKPALDYCLDVEETDDPRRAIAVCLTGRERLLTGEFQRDLDACRPDDHDNGLHGESIPFSSPSPSESSSSAPPVISVEVTANKKIGPVATTYASQATCPASCPFLGRGCYAEVGPCGIHTRRLNASPHRDPLVIAKLEADLIDRIANSKGLRVHTVGDCTTAETAKLVGEAMVRYQSRTGGRAWTYTHGWRETPQEAWAGANVLASCELLSEVRAARARGYATAITLDQFPGKQAFSQDGIKIVPCPEQTIGRTCVQCRMCLDADRLRQAGITIGFAAHGTKAKAVRETVRGGLLRCSLLGWGRSA